MCIQLQLILSKSQKLRYNRVFELFGAIKTTTRGPYIYLELFKIIRHYCLLK